ncbi:helix-turn-helix transcriptional regulator [Bacillus timonensis]|nr:helix-turn-helix transcriptional regulator [Bacillus timonensis]
MDFSIIGQEIKNLRKARNISQKQLSEGICTQAQISNIENGTVYPLATTLYFIAEKLGVDVNYFFEIATSENVDYFNEVEYQLKMARRALDYKEIYRIVLAEKRNPLYQRIPKFKQMIMWHEGICICQLEEDHPRALLLLNEANLLTHQGPILNEAQLQIHMAIGIIYVQDGDLDNGLKMFQIVAKQLTLKPILNDLTIKTRMHYNIARIFSRQGKYQQAIEECKQAKKWCLSVDNLYLFGELTYHIGYNFSLLKRYPEAIQEMRKAITFFEITEDYKHIEFVKEEIRSFEEKH